MITIQDKGRKDDQECIFFFFFKQKTAYEISECLVGSEMCIRDSNNVMVEYLNYEAITDKKCMECKVLPACMGGCPYITINSERKCNSIRYNAEKLIELVYSNQMVDG